MKIENQTNQDVYVVFVKLFEFNQFIGVATSKADLRTLLSLAKKDFPTEKFFWKKVGKKEIRK